MFIQKCPQFSQNLSLSNACMLVIFSMSVQDSSKTLCRNLDPSNPDVVKRFQQKVYTPRALKDPTEGSKILIFLSCSKKMLWLGKTAHIWALMSLGWSRVHTDRFRWCKVWPSPRSRSYLSSKITKNKISLKN